MMRSLALSVAALAVAATVSADAPKTFGKPLSGLKAVALQDVLAKPEAGKMVRLEGTIDKVCQNKGCWLELKQQAASVHVTFENYGFFVPKDSMGKPVVLEGRVVVKEPTKEDVAHLKAEGAGETVAAKVSIEATGVEIR
jgi:poly(3-hydroxybutyrate) depolymerase